MGTVAEAILYHLQSCRIISPFLKVSIVAKLMLHVGPYVYVDFPGLNAYDVLTL